MGDADLSASPILEPASTRVAAIASALGISWTGTVSENSASVVFLWPSGEKVYLDIDPEKYTLRPDGEEARQIERFFSS